MSLQWPMRPTGCLAAALQKRGPSLTPSFVMRRPVRLRSVLCALTCKEAPCLELHVSRLCRRLARRSPTHTESRTRRKPWPADHQFPSIPACQDDRCIYMEQPPESLFSPSITPDKQLLMTDSWLRDRNVGLEETKGAEGARQS